MNAVDYIKEKRRMCDNQGGCNNCPLEGDCDDIESNHPEKAVAIVEKWLAENPEPHRKTYAEDFLEKFPKFKRDPRWLGMPYACTKEFYGIGVCTGNDNDCKACWNTPMPESEDKE